MNKSIVGMTRQNEYHQEEGARGNVVLPPVCQPAQIFLVLFILAAFYGAFFKQTNIALTRSRRGTIFFFLSLCGIGWSAMINYTCGYDEPVIAWGLAALPLMYLALK